MNYQRLWGERPVIIIGMHRSGTTMLTRLLEQAGLFVGRDLCPDTHESRYFQRVNDWILQQPGATWDNPEALRFLWSDARSTALAREYVRWQLTGLPVIRYFGVGGVLQRLASAQRGPWGWKDPRTTYTLPLWLSLFPDAKVLYIARHGVDCAKSLHVRKQKETAHLEGKILTPTRFRVFRHSLRGLSGRNIPTPRCDTLEGGFSLWEAYVDEAQRQLAGIAPERKHVLRFEDLADDFAGLMGGLFRFLGIEVGDAQVAALRSQLQLDRMYAHRKDPELKTFAERKQAALSQRGY
jgi:hypothetical protein